MGNAKAESALLPVATDAVGTHVFSLFSFDWYCFVLHVQANFAHIMVCKRGLFIFFTCKFDLQFLVGLILTVLAAFRQPGDSALASMRGWGSTGPPTPPYFVVGLILLMLDNPFFYETYFVVDLHNQK